MRVVLDASVAVDALVAGTRRAAVLNHLEEAEAYAPHLVDSEVLSALARLERAGILGPDEASDAVSAWLRMPCERLAVEPWIPEIWALRSAVRVADAQYIVLARALDATLLTSDARLARAPIPGVSVLLVN